MASTPVSVSCFQHQGWGSLSFRANSSICDFDPRSAYLFLDRFYSVMYLVFLLWLVPLFLTIYFPPYTQLIPLQLCSSFQLPSIEQCVLCLFRVPPIISLLTEIWLPICLVRSYTSLECGWLEGEWKGGKLLNSAPASLLHCLETVTSYLSPLGLVAVGQVANICGIIKTGPQLCWVRYWWKQEWAELSSGRHPSTPLHPDL